MEVICSVSGHANSGNECGMRVVREKSLGHLKGFIGRCLDLRSTESVHFSAHSAPRPRLAFRLPYSCPSAFSAHQSQNSRRLPHPFPTQGQQEERQMSGCLLRSIQIWRTALYIHVPVDTIHKNVKAFVLQERVSLPNKISKFQSHGQFILDFMTAIIIHYPRGNKAIQ